MCFVFRFLYCIAVCSVITVGVYAQTPSQDIALYSSLFPQEQAVYKRFDETVHITVSNDDIVITSEYDKQLFLLSDNASHFKEETIYYNDFFKISNVSAYSLIPHETKDRYVRNRVRNFQDTDVLRSSFIFHDDLRAKKFLYDGLRRGASTHVTYKQTYLEPHFWGNFFFQSRIPIVEGNFTVYVPHGVEIGYTMFGNADMQERVVYTQKSYKQGVVHVWSVVNMPKYSTDSDAPDMRYFAAHMQVYVKKYTTSSGKEIILYNDVSRLHAWYKELLEKVPMDISPEFMAAADSIKNASVDEEDMVRNVLYWVQDNIFYIAFEAGFDGFIPRGADGIFHRRYGDCKDMSNILVEMLSYMGVTAYHTWIGSRKLPYTYQEVPTTSSDNHMIATYVTSDSVYVFLDATSKLSPYGTPPAFIQGKQALINKKSGSLPYTIKTVPIIPAERNLYYDTAVFTFTDRTIQGKSVITLYGYPSQRIHRRFQSATEREFRDFLKSYTRKGNNTYNVVSYSVSGNDNRETPLELDITFSIQNYIVASGNQMFVNLNMDVLAERYDIRRTRTAPLEYDYKESFYIVNTLIVPDEFRVSHIPEKREFSSDIVSFYIDYELQDNAVVYRFSMQNDALYVDPSQFDVLHDFLTALRSAYRETVILIKK